MQLLQHPARSLVLLACLLACACGMARAQTPVAQQLDVFFGETKLLPIDRPIDSFKVEPPDGIVKVEKSDGAPNQLSIVGMGGGNAMLTIQSDGRTLLYAVTVSPAPERLYINQNESKRLSFPNPIDDTSLSTGGVVRIVQPDSSDKVLLLEAQNEGKTTLTVYSNKEIYRYFISTFANRGADILEIQNSFSAKGYRNLTISFDKDQATVGGSVPTQEELDDAVRIVKQFTDYVLVRATVGQEVDTTDTNSLQAQIVINNIQRIANVKGLTVRVKYAAPTVVTTSTFTKSIGDYIAPGMTTTPQGGTIRGGGFQPPPADQQGPNNTGPTELKPQQNTTQVTTTTENTTLPEKIFLYGDLEDDLDEAKVLRVARTFCPFIVNFLTIKDPIQIRTQIRFMQVNKTDESVTGFFWSGGGPILGGPSFTLGFGPGAVANSFLFTGGNTPAASLASLLNGVSYGVSGVTNASAVFTLMENLGVTKELQTADLFLTNGQPGWFSEGEIQTYVSNVTSVVGTASTNTSATTSSLFFGLNMDIAPLNVAAAGGTESPGQQILGIPGSTSGGSVTASSGPGTTPDQIGKVNAIGAVGNPFIDSTTKYVDENGMIGMNVSTQLTLPGSFGETTIDGVSIKLPDYFVRTTKTRLNLRDAQTVTIDGLIDQELTKTITQVPFLASLPLFGNLFKGHDDTNTNTEVIVLVTPHIIRMRDPNSARYPKPVYPEMQKLAAEYGDIPIIKPVRYDAEAVDIRPESPKDMKDSKSVEADTAPAPAPAPLAPRASGGMQTLQPPAESTAPTPSAVDKTPRAPDISRQPSSAPLAPSSTLP